MIKLKSLLNEHLLNELTVSRLGSDQTNFIAWKDRLFLFGDDTDEEGLLSIYDHLSSHPHFDSVEKYLKPTDGDVNDFFQTVTDFPQDVITGYYYPDKKEIMLSGGHYEKGNPVTSIILPKIVKALGVTKVTKDYGDDDQVTYQKKQMSGKIPSVGYHGTNTNNLEDILRWGMEAGRAASNFASAGVYHDQEIFFAATFKDATFYAENAVRQSKNKEGNHLAVVEVNIPDKSLVVPDWDADATAKTRPELQHYSHGNDNLGISSLKPMAASLEVGKFGYRGKILPQQIRWVWIFVPAMETWKKFKPSTIRGGLQQYGNDWYYRVGLD